MSRHHPFQHLSHLLPKATDDPETQGRAAVRYFNAIESARLALDANPTEPRWEDRPKGPGVPQETVSSQSLTLDDEDEGLSPEVIAAIMSHAKENYDEATCAKLAKYFGVEAEDEEEGAHPPDFPGRPRTGGTLSDDALIDELRAQGRTQGARDAGGRVQTSRTKGADALTAKRNAMGQDRALRLAQDSKDATGGISYSDVAARMRGGRPRQAGSSKQMATDSRARQLREYGSHSASDFMDSPSFDELFPDAKRIKTVIG